jgi:polyhydroxybutyrate depolymerase
MARNNRMLTLLASALTLAMCAACSSHPNATRTRTTRHTCTPTLRSGTYTLNGRAYRVAMPRADGSLHPLVLLFHGFASSKEAIDADTGMEQAGTARGFVVVTPDGTGSPRTWHFLGAGSDDDVAFAGALVGDVTAHACVDVHRVFAAGHSAGSAFTGFLVCRAPYRFAGAAMVEATIPSTCPTNVTYAVVSVHGTADRTVLYDGGLGEGQTVPIPPVRRTVADLATRNGCAAPTTDTPAPGVERMRYSGCAHGHEVELLTIVGGGHPWAGGLQATATEPAVPGARFSATDAVLDFFAGR